LKKYCLSATLVFLQGFPQIVCILNSVLLFLTIISTCWIRPYNKLIFYVSKIGGDTCMVCIWMIFSLKFIPMYKNMNKTGVIEESTAREYLSYGNVVLILLAIINGLYLIEFFYTKIILRIFEFVKSKQKKTVLPS